MTLCISCFESSTNFHGILFAIGFVSTSHNNAKCSFPKEMTSLRSLEDAAGGHKLNCPPVSDLEGETAPSGPLEDDQFKFSIVPTPPPRLWFTSTRR